MRRLIEADHCDRTPKITEHAALYAFIPTRWCRAALR